MKQPLLCLLLLLLRCFVLSAGQQEEESPVDCPGPCIDRGLPCENPVEGTTCLEISQCCLDSTIALADVVPEFDYTTMEVDESAPYFTTTLPPSEEPAFKSCPGGCIRKELASFCDYIVPDVALCSSASVCCLSKEQTQHLLFREPPSQSPTKERSEFTMEEEIEMCLGNCVPSMIPCSKTLAGSCPRGSKCCEVSYSDARVQPPSTTCRGKCIPRHVPWVCREPFEVKYSEMTGCPSGTLCCELPEKDSRTFQQKAGFQVPSQYDLSDRVASDEEGNLYEILADGQVSPLPTLTQEDHFNNEYTQVAETDREGLVILTDIYGNLYQQFIAPYYQGYPEGGSTPEDSLLGMPSEDEIKEMVDQVADQMPNDDYQTESSIPDDVHDIEESMRDLVIPEEGEELAETEFVPLQRSLVEKPACPGICIFPSLKFTCTENVAIYDGFTCTGRNLCCASLSAIEEQKSLMESSPFARPKGETSAQQCGLKARDSDHGKSTNEWCWQIAVINSLHQYLCGGALIGDSWVITAAHCVSGTVKDGQSLMVRAGIADLVSHKDKDIAQTRRVSSVFVHPKHNTISLDHDIALLKLKRPFDMNSNICTVCLPSTSRIPEGKECVVTGYGFPSEEGTMTLKTKAVEVGLVDDTDCMANVTDAISVAYFLPASSFCAGNGSSCQGDAGGPLVCQQNDSYELVGVLSWTLECGLKNVPSVYVKIPVELDWINEVLSSTHETA